MAAKGITIYTPASAGPHVFAEDDAQIHRAILGVSGITLADNELALTVINNNTVRLSSGAYSMQGYLISVQGGTTADLTVESGSAGAYRHDLVVADFSRGGSDVADTFVFAVVKGTNAVSADAAADPTLTQNDLAAGGSRRQEAIYRLIINGTEIAAVERRTAGTPFPPAAPMMRLTATSQTPLQLRSQQATGSEKARITR